MSALVVLVIGICLVLALERQPHLAAFILIAATVYALLGVGFHRLAGQVVEGVIGF